MEEKTIDHPSPQADFEPRTAEGGYYIPTFGWYITNDEGYFDFRMSPVYGDLTALLSNASDVEDGVFTAVSSATSSTGATSSTVPWCLWVAVSPSASTFETLAADVEYWKVLSSETDDLEVDRWKLLGSLRPNVMPRGSRPARQNTWSKVM